MTRARGVHTRAVSTRKIHRTPNMLQRVIGWALLNPLVVVLLAAALAGFGAYAFVHVPAP